LRVQDAGRTNTQNKADGYSCRNFVMRFHYEFLSICERRRAALFAGRLQITPYRERTFLRSADYTRRAQPFVKYALSGLGLSSEDQDRLVPAISVWIWQRVCWRLLGCFQTGGQTIPFYPPWLVSFCQKVTPSGSKSKSAAGQNRYWLTTQWQGETVLVCSSRHDWACNEGACPYFRCGSLSVRRLDDGEIDWFFDAVPKGFERPPVQHISRGTGSRNSDRRLQTVQTFGLLRDR